MAAAGLVALEETPKRLPTDHQNAQYLAAELANLPGIIVDPAKVQTNIVIFDVSATGLSPEQISADLKQRRVLMNGINPRQMRAVTHYDVDRNGCEQAISALAQVVHAAAVRT